ncbi:MAG: hypothetical protein QG573_1367 [Acidobacteriota bacterium]|nr:hypothetical protein [Acidobacteriota bacterium]
MKRRRSQDEEARWVRSVLGAGAPAAGPDRPGADAEAWRTTWDGLELPPAPAVPAGFAHRVALAWAAEREPAAAPILGAIWMRAAAAAALLAGVALGSTLALQNSADDARESLAASLADDIAAGEETWTATLSEEYLLALSTDEADLALPAAAGPGASEAGR